MFRKFILLSLTTLLSFFASAQEVIFFSEGTGQNYYDQSIVDLANLGESYFEHTSPPGLPQYNDKVPCSTLAYKGSTSLKFNYTSSPDGNWKVSIHRADWTRVDITAMDSISFYVFATVQIPASALPMIGLKAIKKAGSGEISSKLYRLSDYNGDVPVGKWTRITFPLNTITTDNDNIEMNFSNVIAIIFNQSETNNVSRTLRIDEITVFKRLEVIPVVSNLTANGYDSHAELSWSVPLPHLSYRIYASFTNGSSYELRAETTDSVYPDFVPAAGRNSTVLYRVVTSLQGRESQPVETPATLRDYSDEELLDMVQKYTFRYFWEGAHKATGMALERSDGDGLTAASGATGMGLMAMIVAHEREYEPGEKIKDRIISILNFLDACDRYHGAWSHWYNANTGHTIPFSTYDNGGDIVETSYVVQALIALKNYFNGQDLKSTQIREKADLLWKGVDWNWYRQEGQNVLYWHWSPDYNFQMNMKVTGWNECLITYVMAASSPSHGIPSEVYNQGWAGNGSIVNKRTYYNHEISLSPDWGGPLFWIHYSHLGLDPRNLKDQYADYWKEHVNTVKIHHAYAVANPSEWENYSEKCWGLTASDDPYGYTAHQPVSNDNGTISPTAALSSIPYRPDEAIKALKYFYRERGRDLFGKYGFYDAVNDELHWVKKAYLGIDQGPIIIMIENYRTALLWNHFMMDADIISGLEELGIQHINISVPGIFKTPETFRIYPNPCAGQTIIDLSGFNDPVTIRVFNTQGRLMSVKTIHENSAVVPFDCSTLDNGFYLIQITDQNKSGQAGIIIQK